jgi:hypothetical protein
MVRSSEVKTKTTKSYTCKTITIRPDKDGQVFTFKQVSDYCARKEKDLEKNGGQFTVQAMNILRNTTLKGYNERFDTQEEYDEYCKNKVNDASKFDIFYSFTITLRENIR